MKHYILAIAVFISILSLSSCKKAATPTDPSSTTSPYYVKATINGVNVTYNGYTAALISIGTLNIAGANSSASLSDGIFFCLSYRVPYEPGIYTPDVNVYPSDPVIPGTYTDTAIIPPYGTNAYYLQDAYIQKYGIQYIPIAYLTSTSPVTPFSVTLTSITDSTVSGTFVGTVYDSPTPTIVTNGSFYVPF